MEPKALNKVFCGIITEHLGYTHSPPGLIIDISMSVMAVHHLWLYDII